ncbi:surfactant protein Bb [Trichomycterus rosablanca]|uniref:surfactant protein Bb n=1 Tax=Trichomycterus rosablanca TaxID=2290929 RepID=UPI002F350A5F
MMAAGAAICVFILSCVLSPGQMTVIRSSSNPLMAENMCSDCTKILELFSDMISQPHAQELIQESLNNVCRRLPDPPTVNECENAVKIYLPLFLERFLAFTAHKEGEICSVLGLCAVQSETLKTPKTPELPSVGLDGNGFLQVHPSTRTSPELEVSPQCTFCLFLMKKLEDMLPKERTEETVVKLLEKICDHLPEHYKDQCNQLLEKYGKEIIDFLLTSATPHTICALIHLCLFQETPAMVPYLPSDCQTCKTLVILSQFHLGRNASEPQVSSVLHKMCHLHPNALPGCEPFVLRHAKVLVTILGKQEEAVNACQKFFCLGRE